MLQSRLKGTVRLRRLVVGRTPIKHSTMSSSFLTPQAQLQSSRALAALPDRKSIASWTVERTSVSAAPTQSRASALSSTPLQFATSALPTARLSARSAPRGLRIWWWMECIGMGRSLSCRALIITPLSLACLGCTTPKLKLTSRLVESRSLNKTRQLLLIIPRSSIARRRQHHQAQRIVPRDLR